MRPILPRGGRARKLLGRLSTPLPVALRRRLQGALARLDYSREERQIASEVSAREKDSGPADGIPVPPPLMRVRVTGSHADRDAWLAASATDARLIQETLRRNNAPLEEMDAFLDFGCGCGRVARHWARLEGPAIHGTDVSRSAVTWCRRNLPFMRTVRCKPDPPLAYGDRSFDFVYALSVLTHLTEEAARGWLAELVRVLRPGGLLLFTVHGERFLDQLDSDEEVMRFRRGEPVVVERPLELAGTNCFATFHPPDYVKGELLPSVDVELVEAVYEDPTGQGLTPMPVQDNYLVRRRPRP